MGAGVERTEPSPRPPAASAAATEAVLGDDDLLREILLRLGFPTCLVRAAAVSKRWLRHASDPAFLRRFRDLNPLRLLGFYVTSLQHHRRLVDFVPMPPQSPELASVLHRGCFSLNAYEGPAIRFTVTDCRNGSVFIGTFNPAENVFIDGVHTPLHPARGLVTVPEIQIEKDSSCYHTFLFLSKEAGGGLYLYLYY
ncbi:hypothetical protein C2845_PM12G09860 [Panicum miliaceum]|uniref:Uncharacterized protein n=1 Tax=Panicum miliaceum TaxID=4540 RepID=A0A3L6QE07_PANMI|nr:hypothetical protein C2845_PM12G09860 [Panicum miliaceum]